MKLRYVDFCSELKNGKLTGLECEDCEGFLFPPKGFCPECGGSKLRQVELSKSGTIKTFTVIRVAPEGFKAPYIVALVELPEGPRVMGNLDYDPDKADSSLMGKKVQIGWKPVPGDKYSAGEGVTLTFSLAA